MSDPNPPDQRPAGEDEDRGDATAAGSTAAGGAAGAESPQASGAVQDEPAWGDPTAPVWAAPSPPPPAPAPPPPPPPASPAPPAPSAAPPPVTPGNPYAYSGGDRPAPQPTPTWDAGGNPPAYGAPASQPGPAYGPGYPAGANPYYTATPTNGSAIALTVVAGITLLSTCLVVGVPSLVLGIMALNANAADPAQSRRRARIGWIVYAANWALLLVVLLAGLFLAFVVRDGGMGSDVTGYS